MRKFNKKKQDKRKDKRVSKLNEQLALFNLIEQNPDIIFIPQIYNKLEKIMGKDLSNITEPVVLFDKKIEIETELMNVMMEDMSKTSMINILTGIVEDMDMEDTTLETDLELMKEMDTIEIRYFLRTTQKLENFQRRERIFGNIEVGV